MERDEDAPAPIPPAGISGSGVTSSIDDTSTGRDRGNSPTGVRATEKVGRFGRPKVFEVGSISYSIFLFFGEVFG
jgi:hypothetical protein